MLKAKSFINMQMFAGTRLQAKKTSFGLQPTIKSSQYLHGKTLLYKV